MRNPTKGNMDGEVSRGFVMDETRQYYRWVTKAERVPLKAVRKQGIWSEEFRRVIFTEQSPFLFELPRRLDNANPSVATQP